MTHSLPWVAGLRPRDKLRLRGAAALTNDELLAVMLRTGYQGKTALEVAHRLLKNRSVDQLLALPLPALTSLKGVGSSRALIIHAAAELFKRGHGDQLVNMNTAAAIAQAATDLHHKKQEHLVCFYLNGRHQLLQRQSICVGTLTSNLIHPREVFAPALELRAASVVLVHNHPSGSSQPSLEDIDATLRIMEAGDILGIPVLDHIIVSAQGWTSLKTEQLI